MLGARNVLLMSEAASAMDSRWKQVACQATHHTWLAHLLDHASIAELSDLMRSLPFAPVAGQNFKRQRCRQPHARPRLLERGRVHCRMQGQEYPPVLRSCNQRGDTITYVCALTLINHGCYKQASKLSSMWSVIIVKWL